MLKDNIFNIIKKTEKNKTVDRIQNKLNGELKVYGYEGGDLIHLDEGHNIITDWAKHALSHLITGDPFIEPNGIEIENENNDFRYAKRKRSGGSLGITPDGVSVNDYHTANINIDGTIVSGRQYFDVNPATYDYWVVSNTARTGVDLDVNSGFNSTYTLFPTKMLFGTGKEYRYDTAYTGTVEDVELQLPTGSDTESLAEVSFIENNEGFNPTGDYFNDDGNNSSVAINAPYNNYSAYFDGSELIKTRTVNDRSTAQLTSFTDPRMYAIKGAVRNAGLWLRDQPQTGASNFERGNALLQLIGNDRYPTNQYRGIGQPAFVYMNRNSRKYDASSEISLASDVITTSEISPGSMIVNPQKGETKITFTVVMPEQTGIYEGEYYPYNGYTLKSAALYADAPMLIGTIDNASYFTGISTDQPDVYNMFKRMPFGLMFAARSIAPILKTPTRTLVFSWTLYF